MVEYFAGGDDNALFLYPDGFVSADVASLAGRLSAAASRGEQGRLELSPSLLARRDQFAILERERPRAMKEFLTNIQVRFGGRDVYLFGFLPLLSAWAEERSEERRVGTECVRKVRRRWSQELSKKKQQNIKMYKS